MCAADCRKRKKSKMFYAGGSDKKKVKNVAYSMKWILKTEFSHIKRMRKFNRKILFAAAGT